jgi:hypothetical protein
MKHSGTEAAAGEEQGTERRGRGLIRVLLADDHTMSMRGLRASWPPPTLRRLRSWGRRTSEKRP